MRLKDSHQFSREYLAVEPSEFSLVEGEQEILVGKVFRTHEATEHLLVERSLLSSLPSTFVGNDVERAWRQMVVIVVTCVWWTFFDLS